ncbi:Uridylate kinase [Frankia sp. AiPs1]|uniref:UMP kinase n=1 Tax=Frankia sp. AiPa1 TaxID=573492 RepID=UPI00202B4A6E|nr:UMP kinase [Frankia sp. AiPa1]MCL9761849.1 UMP kinase [Frankia sp. AiPa1]
MEKGKRETVAKYRRVVVKLSGRAIAGAEEFGFDSGALEHLAREIIAVRQSGVEVAIVVGGGNLFRGNQSERWGIDRVEADNIGMLGTVINSLLLRGKLTALGEDNLRVMTAVPVPAVAEPYIRLRAAHLLEKGATVILACGNGQPFLTTDYPAVQRALELGADAVLAAKDGVDGVYDSDPKVNPDAQRFSHLSYDEVISRGLRVMDQSAFILARDFGIPLHIFDIEQRGAMTAICQGEHRGTVITSTGVDGDANSAALAGSTESVG